MEGSVPTVDLVRDDFGAGPPLVILHGLFGSARNWQSHARALAAQYRVIAVDQRNHGRSPHAAAHDYLALATDLRALLDALALPSVTLLGHSMGGKAAMTFALQAPARVAKLVVVDIGPFAYADTHTPIIAAMEALPLATLTRRQDAEAALVAAVPDAAVRQFLLQNLVLDGAGARWRLNLDALRAGMPALVGALPVAADARYTGSTHFIRGGLSDRVPDADLPRLHAQFPGALVHTVANAGHWPQAEAPAAFTACLAAALAAP